MAWERCKKCQAWRKVDIIISSDGWHQPACYECGDPEYLEPLQEPVFSFQVPEPGVFVCQMEVVTPEAVAGLIFQPVTIQEQDISDD